MTSPNKIAANRENAKKSTGPRTAAGKSRSSRNATRHGLEAAALIGAAASSEEVARLAKAICGDGTEPIRFEQAVIIAESQIMVARVRAARIAAIGRASKQKKLASPGAMTDREFQLFWFQLDDDLPEAVRGIRRRARAHLRYVEALLAAQKANTEEERHDHLRRAHAMLASRQPPDEGDEAGCVMFALSELLALERYERRALSRRRKAIRRFDALGE